jgi:hypothetical protein
MLRGIAVRSAGAVLLLWPLACSSPPSTVSTSIRESDCAEAPGDVRQQFEAKDLGVQQCDGALGWRVLVVSSDENSWIELRSAAAAWSSEASVVYENRIGLFPSVDSESPLEWRVDSRRGPTALLFRVTAQDPADAETRLSRVFVSRIEEDGRICVIGREPSIDEARAVADSDRSCPGSP